MVKISLNGTGQQLPLKMQLFGGILIYIYSRIIVTAAKTAYTAHNEGRSICGIILLTI